jgi:hypothetical protein
MPIISASQLLGKTIFTTKPLSFYKVSEIIAKGDKASPVSNQIKTGYTFKLDSFLTPVEENTKYGFKTAKRSDNYFTWYGNDNGYYAVKYADDGRFSFAKLQEQGVKTVKQIQTAEEEANKTPVQKIEDTVTNLFTGAGKTIKTLLYIGIAVYAIGYLVPKLKK